MKIRKKIFVILGVFLILLSAFQNKIFAYNPVIDGAREYMSDMFEDMQNNGEISQECFEQLKKQAGEELTKAEMTQTLKENLFFFAVGQYANIAEDVVADSLLGLSDIWDYIFWDNDTQSFGFDEDTGDYIKNGLQSIIYDEGSIEGPVVGNWYSVPWSFVGGSMTCNITDSSSNSAPVYVCLVDSGWNYGIYIASFVQYQSATIARSTSSITGSLTTSNRYQGSVSVGFYSPSYGMSGSYRPNITMYSDINTALADLFGKEWSPPAVEPTLNGKGIIVNENPVFPSLSPLGALSPNYKNIVINNYNNGNPYPPNRGLNVNYYDYDYNYEVPFWEGQELDTLEYPEEIEFPTIEFETVAVDSNLDSAIEGLSGWIIEFLLIAILLLVLGLII